MPTLLLRLGAPLQSWGSSSYYDNRETDDMPTKSGIVGMMAAALGRKRDAELADLVKLQMGIRVDAPGRRVRDFQVTKMGEKLNANISTRVYLSDAVFLAGLYSENEDELKNLDFALRHPKYALFLGRRSCPPTFPLSLGIRQRALYEALYEEEWLLPEKVRKRRLWKNEKELLRIVIETGEGEGGGLKKDCPLSFSPFGREYGYRLIKEVSGKDVGGAISEDGVGVSEKTEDLTGKTEHDAFEEVEQRVHVKDKVEYK